MNNITIKFTHPKIESPIYCFGDRVAMAGDCQPNQWFTGKVVGLCLEEKLISQWLYAVQLDSPQGWVEEYHAEDLVLECNIPKEESEEKCDLCEGSGYTYDHWTGQRDTCESCFATGVKDFARELRTTFLTEG